MPIAYHLVPAVVLGFLLSGCFVLVEKEAPEPANEIVIINHAPYIFPEETSWFCEYSPVYDDYFFEFETLVDDADGLSDVRTVDVEVYFAGTDLLLADLQLANEGFGLWAGYVWESETSLYCGDPMDVVFEAIDFLNGWDRLVIPY